jgi:hypothetical protein
VLLVSVVVKFDPWGRLGNRMFQFAFGYLLAKQKNDMLYTEGLPNFNIPAVTCRQHFSNYTPTSMFGRNMVNFEVLLQNDNIVVDSFVQKAAYYINFQNELRDIFNIKNNDIKNTNKLVLHIRETDYNKLNCFLGYEYYKQIIKETGFTDVIIVTDNSNCETVQKLVSEGCTVNTTGSIDTFNTTNDERAMKDFFTLLQSENIALSHSSFSWWAAFLGQHQKIFFPYFKNDTTKMWKLHPEKDDIDLFFNFNKSYKIIL